MIDFAKFCIALLIVFGLLAAVPVLGIVVGVGFGAWFLWEGFKEHQNHVRRSK